MPLQLTDYTYATQQNPNTDVPMQDFHTRVEGALVGEDLAQLLSKVFKAGHEQEDELGAARAAQSAVCKLEIKVSWVAIVSDI